MHSGNKKIHFKSTFLKGILVLLAVFLILGAKTSQVKAQVQTASETGAGVIVETTEPDASGTSVSTGGISQIEQDKAPAGDPASSLAWMLAQVIYVFTVGLGSAVAAVAAGILNIAVSISLDSAAYGLDFISTGWTMIRDLANMAFIFILVYIALKVMFQAHTAGTMGMLAKVLAVALVINFSFFATRVVIDAGNLISVQFYNAVVGNAPNSTINPIAGVGTVSAPDITKKIMDGVNFQTALGPDSFKNISSDPISQFGATFIAYAFIYIALGAMLFMLAAAFVTAGVKFIVRIVMLWMSIITAPLALVAWSFQAGGHGGGHGGGYFSTWRKNLISHAFYPAVFLFVLLIISNFMGGMGSGGLGAGFIQDSVNNGQVGIPALAMTIANIAVRLGFVLVMLYFAIKASDYFEVAGASVAKAWGNNFAFDLPGKALRLGLGGSSRLLNNTLNRDEKGQVRSKVADSVLSFSSKRSFDVRTPLAKIGVTKDFAEKQYGKPDGEGGWDGYLHHKAAEDKKKADAIAKENTDHADPKAEQKEQKKFEKEYDSKNGGGAFEARTNELIHAADAARKEQVELTKQQIELAKVTKEDIEGMSAEAREAHNKLVDENKKSTTTNKKSLANAENTLKTLKGMGQRVVESRHKEHIQEVAVKLMSSNKTVNYLAGKKMLMGKSNKDKLAEAAKAMNEEDKEVAEPHGDEPKPAAGGDVHGAGGGGAHPPEH